MWSGQKYCAARLTMVATLDGGFFVFGDISIKLLGKHRLNFSLFELQKYVPVED